MPLFSKKYEHEQHVFIETNDLLMHFVFVENNFIFIFSIVYVYLVGFFSF